MPDVDQQAYKDRATSIIESHGYVANAAHAAVEAKPPVIWNKGMFVVDNIATEKNIHLHNKHRQ